MPALRNAGIFIEREAYRLSLPLLLIIKIPLMPIHQRLG
jgi:hypothetical protein